MRALAEGNLQAGSATRLIGLAEPSKRRSSTSRSASRVVKRPAAENEAFRQTRRTSFEEVHDRRLSHLQPDPGNQPHRRATDGSSASQRGQAPQSRRSATAPSLPTGDQSAKPASSLKTSPCASWRSSMTGAPPGTAAGAATQRGVPERLKKWLETDHYGVARNEMWVNPNANGHGKNYGSLHPLIGRVGLTEPDEFLGPASTSVPAASTVTPRQSRGSPRSPEPSTDPTTEPSSIRAHRSHPHLHLQDP